MESNADDNESASSDFSFIDDDAYGLEKIETTSDDEASAAGIEQLEKELAEGEDEWNTVIASMKEEMAKAQTLIDDSEAEKKDAVKPPTLIDDDEADVNNGNKSNKDSKGSKDNEESKSGPAAVEFVESGANTISALRDEAEKKKTKSDGLRIKVYECKRRHQRRAQKIQSAIEVAKQATHVDIAFIMDSTFSMQEYIDETKRSIESIVSDVSQTHQGLKVRFALVAYRDLDSAVRVQALDFVEDVESFKTYLDGVEAIGGADYVEDMAIGIQKANSLSWANSTRVAIIVGDYPCHGVEFHSLYDDYPAGTPDVDIVQEMKQLRDNHAEGGTMNIYFGRITEHTDDMVDRFRNHYGVKIEVVDFSSLGRIKEAVTTSIRNSIFNTVTVSGTHMHSVAFCDSKINAKEVKVKPFEIVEHLPAVDEWMPVKSVKVFRNLAVKSISDLKKPVSVGVIRFVYSLFGRSKRATDKTTESVTYVRRAREPFAQGGSRIVFHAQMSDEDQCLSSKRKAMVLKTFKHFGGGVNKQLQYFKQMEVSSVAHYLAKKYNKSQYRPAHCAEIHVAQVCVIEETDEENEAAGNRRFCAEEPIADGCVFTRFSNNTGYWHWDNLDESLVRFCDYTYTMSKGYLMVADMQGVKRGKTIHLTDPAILCQNLDRFGATNTGEDGMNAMSFSIERIMQSNGWKRGPTQSRKSKKGMAKRFTGIFWSNDADDDDDDVVDNGEHFGDFQEY